MRFVYRVVVLLYACAVFAFGQEATGSLSGTVLDASGAVIPKVLVVIIGPKTLGDPPSVETDDGGGFSFSNLAPGEYAVEAVSPGFHLSVLTGIEIAVGDRKVLRPVVLKVGDFNNCGLSGDGPRSHVESSRRLPGQERIGVLKGSVQMYRDPRKGWMQGVSGAEVRLVCKNGGACGATTTDQFGGFRLDGIAAGDFSLRITRKGFYPVDGIAVSIGIGLELDYSPLTLEPCDDRKCDPSEHQKKKERERKEFLAQNPGFVCL